MTDGPAHYREAERLLGLADSAWGVDGDAGLLAAAQVHATLAQAAAVATLNGALLHIHDQGFGTIDTAWVKVAETGATAHPGGAA